MVDGKLNCTVECNPLLGPAAFDAVQAALEGKKLEKRTIVRDQVYPQEKAAAALPERKY
jgi:simple sugar transport system substrate-binding protein